MPGRLTVVGSANIDFTTRVEKIPRAGETAYGEKFLQSYGGKGANQAVAASLLGAEVTLVAKTGDDPLGQQYRSHLQSSGVDISCLSTAESTSTGVATILVEPSGQNRIIVVKGANDFLSESDILAAEDAFAQSDYLIIQLEIPLDTVRFAIELAQQVKIPVILNPAPATKVDAEFFSSTGLLSRVEFLIPNEIEAQSLTGISLPSDDNLSLYGEAFSRLGIDRVVLTRGEAGCVYFCQDKAQHYHGVMAKAVDTTGAGDAFVGSLGTFLAAGKTPEEAIPLANQYASLSVQKAGTQTSYISLEAFEQSKKMRTE